LTYIQENDVDGMNPRRLFDLDFHAALRLWKSNRERTLVFMDMNDHVLNGKCTHRLMKDSMLNLVKVTHHHWKEEVPHLHINGKDPIDSVCCTQRTLTSPGS
jgi:hypothetical protein